MESHLICFSTFYMSFNKYFTSYTIISLSKPKGRKRKKNEKNPKVALQYSWDEVKDYKDLAFSLDMFLFFLS